MKLFGDEAYAAMCKQLFSNECDCDSEPCTHTNEIMGRLSFETDEIWEEEFEEV